MMGRTHLMAGMALCFTVLDQDIATSPEAILALSAGYLIGSIAPDIDHPRSIISRQAGIVGGILRLFVRHRGLTHSLLFFSGLLLLWGVMIPSLDAVAVQFIIGFAGGYIVHVIMDMMTISGVPLAYPSQRRFYLLPKPVRIRTGSIREWIVMGLLVFSMVSDILSHYGIMQP